MKLYHGKLLITFKEIPWACWPGHKGLPSNQTSPSASLLGSSPLPRLLRTRPNLHQARYPHWRFRHWSDDLSPSYKDGGRKSGFGFPILREQTLREFYQSSLFLLLVFLPKVLLSEVSSPV